jgi:hypothetical protein
MPLFFLPFFSCQPMDYRGQEKRGQEKCAAAGRVAEVRRHGNLRLILTPAIHHSAIIVHNLRRYGFPLYA